MENEKLTDQYTAENLKTEIVKIMLNELEKRNILKKNRDAFDSTKELLRNYNSIKASKKKIRKQINRLEKSKEDIDGGPYFTGKSIVVQDEKGLSLKKDLSTLNTRIVNLEQEIVKIDCFIEFIDNVLQQFKNDEDYDLIERIYLKKELPETIAQEKSCDVTTIYRKINKKINEIKVLLFPGKIVDELT